MARAWRVCLDCPEPVPPGRSRCDECRRAADKARGTAHQRGYDSTWKRTRAEHLRMEPTCVECGRLAVAVDHIDGLGPKGPRGHDHSNLRSMCKPCHDRRTARDQPGGWNAR